ncbi:hypothetical protein [Burkholderia sp. L27(2015)]|nr:hypothetical protein [Burkholderia sp. L27(2015)]
MSTRDVVDEVIDKVIDKLIDEVMHDAGGHRRRSTAISGREGVHA